MQCCRDICVWWDRRLLIWPCALILPCPLSCEKELNNKKIGRLRRSVRREDHLCGLRVQRKAWKEQHWVWENLGIIRVAVGVRNWILFNFVLRDANQRLNIYLKNFLWLFWLCFFGYVLMLISHWPHGVRAAGKSGEESATINNTFSTGKFLGFQSRDGYCLCWAVFVLKKMGGK